MLSAKQGRGKGIAHGWCQRSSNFYITINTNKTVGNVYDLTNTEKANIEKFEKVWKDFFDMPTNHYINIIGREPSDTMENLVRDIIKDSQTEYLSSGHQMIHAHILIQIKHYTKLQFNTQAFREYLTKEMKLPSTYVHMEHVSDSCVPSLLLNIYLQRR